MQTIKNTQVLEVVFLARLYSLNTIDKMSADKYKHYYDAFWAKMSTKGKRAMLLEIDMKLHDQPTIVYDGIGFTFHD